MQINMPLAMNMPLVTNKYALDLASSRQTRVKVRERARVRVRVRVRVGSG